MQSGLASWDRRCPLPPAGVTVASGPSGPPATAGLPADRTLGRTSLCPGQPDPPAALRPQQAQDDLASGPDEGEAFPRGGLAPRQRVPGPMGHTPVQVREEVCVTVCERETGCTINKQLLTQVFTGGVISRRLPPKPLCPSPVAPAGLPCWQRRGNGPSGCTARSGVTAASGGSPPASRLESRSCLSPAQTARLLALPARLRLPVATGGSQRH